MKKILSNSITRTAELIALILGIIWFIQEKSFEPLIISVVSVSGLIVNFFLKNEVQKPRLEVTFQTGSKSHSSLRPSSKTPRTPNGNYDFTEKNINMIGKRDVTWNFSITISNQSSITAFKPQLLIKEDLKNIRFKGNLKREIPIKGGDRVELKFSYMKTTDGTQQERDAIFARKIPKEILKNFKLIIICESEEGGKILNKFRVVSNNKEFKSINQEIKNIPNDFKKASILFTKNLHRT